MEGSQRPLISVIVPVYNGEAYLENCIDSILHQSYAPLEIILVNNGSVDGTEQLCGRLAGQHGNIHVIKRQQGGVSAARNTGLAQAKGELITFVDADDRIHPEMLRILYDGLEGTGSDVAGCTFFCWQTEREWKAETEEQNAEENGRNTGAQGEDKTCRSVSAKQFVLEGILKNDTRCWSKLYRKSILQGVRFREGLSIGEDMLFLVELLPNIKRVAVLDFPGYGYYQNPAGAMMRPFCPAYMDQITCWELAGERMESWAAQERSLTPQERQFIQNTMSARLLVGILLTAGKLAVLSPAERRKNRAWLQLCHRKLKNCLEQGYSEAYLDRGYRVKVKLFAAAPGLYAAVYGRLKRKGRR